MYLCDESVCNLKFSNRLIKRLENVLKNMFFDQYIGHSHLYFLVS